MRKQLSPAMALLVAGLLAFGGAAQAQPVRASELAAADATSNVPPRAGEASTMTHGVPNLLTSNVQPGELGIQSRLTVGPAAPAHGGEAALKLMGASGPMRPALVAPPPATP